MLTLIKGEKQGKKSIDYESIYLRVFVESYQKYIDDNNKNFLFQTIHSGVNYVNLFNIDSIKEVNNAQIFFTLAEEIKRLISLLTPNELTRLFPVTKGYDGSKWQTKDYFTTMKALNDHGMNTPLGDKLDKVLWNYMDFTLFEYQAQMYEITSLLYRAQTGKTPIQEFCEDNNIETYTIRTDQETGKQYIIDSRGKSTRVKKKLPRYLRVLEK